MFPILIHLLNNCFFETSWLENLDIWSYLILKVFKNISIDLEKSCNLIKSYNTGTRHKKSPSKPIKIHSFKQSEQTQTIINNEKSQKPSKSINNHRNQN